MWNGILYIVNRTEESFFIYRLGGSLERLLHKDIDYAPKCWQANLETRAFRYNALVAQLLKRLIALNGVVVVACARFCLAELLNAVSHLLRRVLFHVDGGIVNELGHHLRYSLEEIGLEVREVVTYACLAIWNALQAIWHAFAALSED